MFEHVILRLSEGKQPDIELLASVGYLMRTTAVYGSGKFGCADREKISKRPETRGAFQVELIAVYLFYVLGSEYTLKPVFSTNKPLLAMSLIVYPLVDLLRVFVIRIRNKKSPFSPDQNHLHHLLIKKGYSHYEIVLIILSTSLVFLSIPFIL